MTDLFDDKIYVGIVGSRRRNERRDYLAVLSCLQDVCMLILVSNSDIQKSDIKTAREQIFELMRGRLVIVSGGCMLGADRFAEEIAREYKLETIIHRPDRDSFPGVPQPWRATKQNYARNTLIATDSKDQLIACVALDRKGGTEDTITKYERIHGRKAILV